MRFTCLTIHDNTNFVFVICPPPCRLKALECLSRIRANASQQIVLLPNGIIPNGSGGVEPPLAQSQSTLRTNAKPRTDSSDSLADGGAGAGTGGGGGGGGGGDSAIVASFLFCSDIRLRSHNLGTSSSSSSTSPTTIDTSTPSQRPHPIECLPFYPQIGAGLGVMGAGFNSPNSSAAQIPSVAYSNVYNTTPTIANASGGGGGGGGGVRYGTVLPVGDLWLSLVHVLAMQVTQTAKVSRVVCDVCSNLM